MFTTWVDPRNTAGVGRRDGFSPAVRALYAAKANGVYAIRERATGRVLYVGESHTRRLYHTLVRHLCAWSYRSKRSQRLYHGKQSTYDRHAVEIAFATTDTGAEAIQAQGAWIYALRPTDNVEDIPSAPPAFRAVPIPVSFPRRETA